MLGRLQRAADQRRKHHQQRCHEGKLQQEALRAGQTVHRASVEPAPGLAVRRTVAGDGGFSAGLRPAPAQCNVNVNGNGNGKSGHSVGWRGGSGCGGRRKYVLVGLAAACSCALSCAHGKTGVGRPAQPARGMPRAHAADTPATGPTPPSTVGRDLAERHGVGAGCCATGSDTGFDI